MKTRKKIKKISNAVKKRIKRKLAPQKIAIVAYEKFHYEVVTSIIKKYKPQKNYVEIFTNNKVTREVSALLGNMSKDVFWRIISKEKFSLKNIEEFDMVILPSPEYSPNRYMGIIENPKRKYRTIAMMHNLNYDDQKGSLQNKLFDASDEIAVLDSNLRNTLLERGMIKKIHVYSPECEVINSQTSDKNKVNITISGEVSSKRRDYQEVVDALKLLPDQGKKIELTLLGKPGQEDGANIIAEFKNIENERIEIKCFSEFVSMEKFKKYMKETDLLLAPSKSETIFNGIKEYYGKTKGQGVINEVIRYAKPVIGSIETKLPEEMNEAVVYYSNLKELAAIITKCEKQEYLENLQERALKCAKRFNN